MKLLLALRIRMKYHWKLMKVLHWLIAIKLLYSINFLDSISIYNFKNSKWLTLISTKISFKISNQLLLITSIITRSSHFFIIAYSVILFVEALRISIRKHTPESVDVSKWKIKMIIHHSHSLHLWWWQSLFLSSHQLRLMTPTLHTKGPNTTG